LVWSHRKLWPLAFITALGGTLGETMVVSRGADFGAPGLAAGFWRSLPSARTLGKQWVVAWWQGWRENPGAMLRGLAALAAIGLIGAALAWVSVVAQGALVHAVAVAGAGRPVMLGDSWGHGQRRFWPLLGAALTVKIAVALVFLALLQLTWLPAAAFIPLFVAGCGMVLWLAALWKSAAAAIVLQDRGVAAAWSQARRGFVRRGAASLGLAGWLFLLTIFSGLAVLAAVLLVSIPFNLLLGTAVLLHFVAGGQLYFFLSWATIVSLVAIAALLVTGIHWAAWTLVFVASETDRTIQPKL
jgi:hypothetical protein